METSSCKDHVWKWDHLDMPDLIGPQDDGEGRVPVAEDDSAGGDLGITP